MTTLDTRAASTPAQRSKTRLALAVAVGVGLVGSGAVVYQASFAAFTDTTSNEDNAWTSGSLTLTDDDGGEALFSVANLHGGESGEKCITVTSTGSLARTVTMSAATPETALADALDLTVEHKAGAAAADCTDFGTGTPVFTGKLSDLEDGLATTSPESWVAAAGVDGVHAYRISWSAPTADNAVPQSGTANATFTWDARTTGS